MDKIEFFKRRFRLIAKRMNKKGLTYLPGIYKPLNDSTFHDGFMLYFRMQNKYYEVLEKMGEVEAEL
jgi:hypothetical protein